MSETRNNDYLSTHGKLEIARNEERQFLEDIEEDDDLEDEDLALAQEIAYGVGPEFVIDKAIQVQEEATEGILKPYQQLGQ